MFKWCLTHKYNHVKSVIDQHSMKMLYKTKYAVVYHNDEKVLKHFNSKANREMYYHEKQALKTIGTMEITNVPKMLEFCDENTYILMTYNGTDGMDLCNTGKMTDEIWEKFVFQIYPVINEIHARGYVHRDIKPENVTYLNGVWSIIDLGFMEKDSIPLIGMFGTYPYCSPILGNKWAWNMFVDNNDPSMAKKANDYYGFAMTVLSLKDRMAETVHESFITVDLLKLQRMVITCLNELLVSCAYFVLSLTNLNYEHMTWFTNGKCIFSKRRTSLITDINRNVTQNWKRISDIISKKQNSIKNADVQIAHKYAES